MADVRIDQKTKPPSCKADSRPENDRIRFTISPEARREVLSRLLELNHKIHAEEMKAVPEKGASKSKSKKKKDALEPRPELGME